MSVENVKAFFEKIEKDEKFREEFLKNEKLEKGNPETIISAASEAGYTFTNEDFEAAKKELDARELTPEELERISGGIGVGFCYRFGAGYFFTDLGGDKSVDPGSTGFCFVVGFN